MQYCILARNRVSRCSVIIVIAQIEKRSVDALSAYRIRAIRSKTPTRGNAVKDIEHRLTPAYAGDHLPYIYRSDGRAFGAGWRKALHQRGTSLSSA